jgi:aspartyl protease family protein
VDGDGVPQVVLKRNRSGHYVATGSINGFPVIFLLDTGATDVAVPRVVADRLGLKRGAPVVNQTANGQVTSWRTRLDEVRLGPVRRRNVRASILPNMQGSEVLLGMSFLKHLEMVQRDGRMTLRQY